MASVAPAVPTATARASSPAKIPFRFHPRVFAALGADLVTNDVVAVMELVKNSYDAGARKVTVRFGGGSPIPEYLEIEDDGCGMSRDIVEKVWCVVATPHKARNSMIGVAGRRRVSGEKGLGRLSAARLGDEFRMWTRARGEPCLEVRVSWPSFAKIDESAQAAVELRSCDDQLQGSGTRIRISELRKVWDSEQIADLRSNLSRLVSPFADTEEFDLFLLAPGTGDAETVRVEPDEFLTKPKYRIEGSVNPDGDIAASYRFAPLAEDGVPRQCAINLSWLQVRDSKRGPQARVPTVQSPRCGPFDFEIRAWDIDRHGIGEIADRFELKRTGIRNAIRAHKGISVYRDGILVLPKSEAARDWLGLDLQRVSKIGSRLSTNQIVGYVSISSQRNPNIRDTSDREKLTAGPALSDFERLLVGAAKALEAQRDRDRPDPRRRKAMISLFADLSPETTLESVRMSAQEGKRADAILPVVERYGQRVEQNLKTIRRRFVYYSQLATVGTIAQMLVHEIRNRTTAIGRFLTSMKDRLDRGPNRRLKVERDRADRAVTALEALADGLSPMASRSFRRGRRTAIVEECIRQCLDLERARIRRLGVQCRVPDSRTAVAVDPGELDTVLLNLITNALYWLTGVKDRQREIAFAVEPGGTGGRVEVRVEDSGPGIAVEDEEEVFLPGVTAKPGGMGMGLTVARELVSAYDGAITARSANDGVRFTFDLPARVES